MKNSKIDEIEIIKKIQSGDISLFSLLVDKYKDVSFSLACSILQNKHDAEDALQEAFIKAYKALNKFKFKSSFSTWFYKIVVNTSKSKYKSRSRAQNLIKSDANENHEPPYNDFDLENLDSIDQKEIIDRILKLLKAEEALLLQLYYLAEMSTKEIKQVTGFGNSKIKVTLHRARKSFYDKLQRKYGNESIID